MFREKELITTMFVSVSNGCNATGNTLPAGGVCFFAEAVTPNGVPAPAWDGNAQARVAAAGGASTVNFKFFGPTAITLENFTARTETANLFYAGLALLGTAGVLIGVAAWQKRRETLQ